MNWFDRRYLELCNIQIYLQHRNTGNPNAFWFLRAPYPLWSRAGKAEGMDIWQMKSVPGQFPHRYGDKEKKKKEYLMQLWEQKGLFWGIYYVPTTYLIYLQMLLHFPFRWVKMFSSPFYRLREVIRFGQIHTTSLWWTQDFNPPTTSKQIFASPTAIP